MPKDPKDDDSNPSEEVYYPSFFFKERIMMMVVFILVAIVLAGFFQLDLEDAADPTDNLYVPKPEWYFMSFYQLLKYVPGRLEVIAAAVILLSIIGLAS